jgi:hypothetical protein
MIKVGACPTQQSLGLGIGLQTLTLPSNCFRSCLNAKQKNECDTINISNLRKNSEKIKVVLLDMF